MRESGGEGRVSSAKTRIRGAWAWRRADKAVCEPGEGRLSGCVEGEREWTDHKLAKRRHEQLPSSSASPHCQTPPPDLSNPMHLPSYSVSKSQIPYIDQARTNHHHHEPRTHPNASKKRKAQITQNSPPNELHIPRNLRLGQRIPNDTIFHPPQLFHRYFPPSLPSPIPSRHRMPQSMFHPSQFHNESSTGQLLELCRFLPLVVLDE